MADPIVETVRAFDTAEDFALDESELARIEALLATAMESEPLDRDRLDAKTQRGKLAAQLARAVSLAATEPEHAGQLADEFCRAAVDLDGARALVAVADAVDRLVAGLDSAPVRLYGLHRLGDDERLRAALDGVDDSRIPPSLLADLAALLDDAGDHARAAHLADRAIAYHVRRKEPESAFLAWMVAEASGAARIGTLLRYLKSLYDLDPDQVADSAQMLAERETQSGNREALLRVLRTIIRLTESVPPYFVATIRDAFPEAEVIGARLDLIDDYVDPTKKDPLRRVETILTYLPGRYAYIAGKMVARVRETDGRTLRLEGPHGERFDETYNPDTFQCLTADDYRVGLRYEPDRMRQWVKERPVEFVQHIIDVNGGQIVDDQLRIEMTAIMSQKAFDAWMESTRAALKAEKNPGIEFSMRTMSFQVKKPPKKKEPDDD